MESSRTTDAPTDAAPNPTFERWSAVEPRLTAVVDAVAADRWDAPSPCEGWAARDVVAHLIDTQRAFLSERVPGVGPLEPVEVGDDPAAAWHRHLAEVEPLMADPDVVATPFDGWFGPTTVGDTLQRFYLFDMVVHRWDLATAAGLPAPISDEELDVIEAGADGFGDSLYMDGVCRPGVEAPEGADRQARVLARLGRS